jgi:hypothetical protein
VNDIRTSAHAKNPTVVTSADVQKEQKNEANTMHKKRRQVEVDKLRKQASSSTSIVGERALENHKRRYEQV